VAIHKCIYGIFTKSQRVAVCAKNIYVILYKHLASIYMVSLVKKGCTSHSGILLVDRNGAMAWLKVGFYEVFMTSDLKAVALQFKGLKYIEKRKYFSLPS